MQQCITHKFILHNKSYDEKQQLLAVNTWNKLISVYLLGLECFQDKNSTTRASLMNKFLLRVFDTHEFTFFYSQLLPRVLLLQMRGLSFPSISGSQRNIITGNYIFQVYSTTFPHTQILRPFTTIPTRLNKKDSSLENCSLFQ